MPPLAPDTMGRHSTPAAEDRWMLPYGLVKSHQRLPLVSCIMPTSDRRRFVPQAIRYFLRQDYPNKELVILDDGYDSIVDLVPLNDPRIIYVRMQPGGQVSLGEKRNICIYHSRGDIVSIWDDDDWYSDQRLSFQVLPIVSGASDVTALDQSLILTLGDSQFWICSPDVHSKMFYGSFISGTLTFRKSFWTHGVTFGNFSISEDADYYRRLIACGARFNKLVNRGHFVYIRHKANTWSFQPGDLYDPAGWYKVDLPQGYMPHTDLVFYAAVAKDLKPKPKKCAETQTDPDLWVDDPNGVDDEVAAAGAGDHSTWASMVYSEEAEFDLATGQPVQPVGIVT